MSREEKETQQPSVDGGTLARTSLPLSPSTAQGQICCCLGPLLHVLLSHDMHCQVSSSKVQGCTATCSAVQLHPRPLCNEQG